MYSEPSYDERELQSRLAEGDAAAFEKLYRRYDHSLKIFLLRYVKVPELAEDLSQEVFGKIWESRHLVGQVNSFRAYLFAAARNHTLTFLTRASKIEAAKGLMIRHMPSFGSKADDEIISQEYQQWLDNVLAGMGPQMRHVFVLVKQEYRSYDEVAELLGISRNTVKKHMLRSLKIIRNKLDDELGISLGVLLVIISR